MNYDKSNSSIPEINKKDPSIINESPINSISDNPIEELKPFDEIKIERDKNLVEFFIKAKGHNLSFYKVNKDDIIKNVIEKYIQQQKLEENIKNNFFCGDKPIDNLEAKISDLKIKTLDIIIEK